MPIYRTLNLGVICVAGILSIGILFLATVTGSANNWLAFVNLIVGFFLCIGLATLSILIQFGKLKIFSVTFANWMYGFLYLFLICMSGFAFFGMYAVDVNYRTNPFDNGILATSGSTFCILVSFTLITVIRSLTSEKRHHRQQ